MDGQHKRVRTKQNLQWYKDKLEALFYALPDTLRAIATPVSEGGTGGNWAPVNLS